MIPEKTALFIAPKFFHYDSLIENELKKHFTQVHRMLDRPFQSAILQILSRFFPTIVSKFLTEYYQKQISKIESQIDYILIVNGQTLPQTVIKEAKAANPDCKIVLYMWDSFDNRTNSLEISKYADSTYTFDNLDAKRYNFRLLPLFHTAATETSSEHEYDVCFIGTLHTDRHVVLQKILNNLGPETKSYVFLYIKRKWIFDLLKLARPSIRKIDPNTVFFKPLPKDTIDQIVSRSKTILDIEHPKQRGLTIRTIECIGQNKKIISTNLNIKNYEFYNEKMITVVNRKQPSIPPSFIKSQSSSYPPAVLESLSLSSWVRTLVQ